jgi:hypothetical protein
MAKRAPRASSAVHVPLVSAHTKGLYRDSVFWQFHYPDQRERARAEVEYELACLDPDPVKAFDKFLTQTPNTSPDSVSWLGRLFGRRS